MRVSERGKRTDAGCVKWRRGGETEDRTEQRVREGHWCQKKSCTTRQRADSPHGTVKTPKMKRCLTSCVAFTPAGGAIVAPSSPTTAALSSFLCGAFFVDCILICGGLELDGKLLVDCSSWKKKRRK